MDTTKQLERQRAGDSFQEEMRQSWKLLADIWRIRIPDGGGTSRPADELILTPTCNILAEHKRTSGVSFKYSFLRTSQIKGLLQFDKVLPQNYGMVFVSFLNSEVDEAYAFRLPTVLRYMWENETRAVTLTALRKKKVPSINLPRILTPNGPAYDLEEVLTIADNDKF